jgi:hypothetical protein
LVQIKICIADVKRELWRDFHLAKFLILRKLFDMLHGFQQIWQALFDLALIEIAPGQIIIGFDELLGKEVFFSPVSLKNN